MTNYEWLVKNYSELVKDILSHQLGKVKGKPTSCSGTRCDNCEFNDVGLICCDPIVREWLEMEHEPLYKKGDIIIDSYNRMVLVVEDSYGKDIMVSRYVDDYKLNQHTISITDIKKIVGHIDESED